MSATANPGPASPGTGKQGGAAPTGHKIHTLRLSGRPLPAPMEIAGLVGRVDAVAQRLGVAGLGGEPPVRASALPDPEGLLDEVRTTRVGYVMRAEKLFGQNMAPVGEQLAQLKELVPRNQAAWHLYRGSYLVMTGVADFQLSAAPAHRLVRWRVLPAVAKTLQQEDLPDAERDGLAKDLAEMQGLINLEAADLRAKRDLSDQNTAELDQELAELDAEEHLVNVMLRVTTKQQVTDEELMRAGATYARLMAAAEAADSQEQGDAQASDRRGGAR